MSQGEVEIQKVIARARLALRAERAFGLNALPVTIQESAAAAPAAQIPLRNQVPAAPSKPAPDPAPRPRLGGNGATDLFGNPARSAAPTAAQNPLSIQTTEPFATPVLSRDQKISQLKVMNDTEVSVCVKCRLCQTRTNTVFGEGDPDAKIFFIGEGPGETEDLQGRPFVGRAGELLNKWIAAMGLRREQVFIANIVKCRPPENREPAPDETAACTPYLLRQLEIVRPQVIITLGRPSSQYMLQTKISMGKMRGQWYDWRGIKMMPTYHPAYVLRNYSYETRAAVWSDLQQVMQELKLPLPKRGTEKQS
jgi:DNA polymerase